MSETEKQLARAKQTYDASGAKTPGHIGGLVSTGQPKGPTQDPGDFDPDVVQRARMALWHRLPKVHRAKQVDLAARIRNASLLALGRAWTWGSPSVLISGPTESGKSSAAALVALRLMSKGHESEWRRWRGIRWEGANQLTNYARSWPLGSGECPDLRAAATCELLILDDLGNEQDWQTTMFDLLQTRYERGLGNIVTTGLRPQQLVERYGEAIVRRLIQRDGKMGTLVDCWDKP